MDEIQISPRLLRVYLRSPKYKMVSLQTAVGSLRVSKLRLRRQLALLDGESRIVVVLDEPFIFVRGMS